MFLSLAFIYIEGGGRPQDVSFSTGHVIIISAPCGVKLDIENRPEIRIIHKAPKGNQVPGGLSAMTTVITGSASGLGAAVKSRLEKAGERVIGIDLRDADIIADLSTPEGRDAAIVGVKQFCSDRLDHFVAAAGVAPDAHNTSLVISVNYFGVIELLDGLFELLQHGHNPSAVVVSSNSAQMGDFDNDPCVLALLDHDETNARKLASELDAFSSGYGRSKNAVARAVRHRAADWGRAGVRLNAIAPGSTKTPMLKRILEDPIGDLVKQIPTPLGRYAEADEIAAVVDFLLSEQASYVHGSVYYVDGGQDAQIRPHRF